MGMTSEDYRVWVIGHANLFQLHSPADAGMFVAWKPLLLRFSLEELQAASNWLAAQNPCFRTEHLAALIRRMDSKRAEKWRRQEEAQNQPGEECSLCGGMGWAQVPHPKNIVGGCWGWPWATAVVTCTCFRGRAKHERLNRQAREKERPAPMALEVFEGLCPDWWQQMQARAETKRQIQAAGAAAAAADKESRPPLKKDLRTICRKLRGRQENN